MILDNGKFPQVFIIEAKKLNSFEFNFLLRFADDYIKERMLVNMPEEKKNKMLIANILRKYLVSKHFKIPFEKQEIIFNEFGKPGLFNEEVFFNVSYSGKYAVCAISNKNVGVDIQKIEKFNQNSARYVFDDSVVDFIKNSENPDLEYTKQWAKLESFLKHKGTGFVNFSKTIDETIKQKFLYIEDYVISLHWD